MRPARLPCLPAHLPSGRTANARPLPQEEGGAAPVVVQAEVGDAHRDCGYLCTSRMVLEAALCLALQGKELDASPDLQKGGVLTPASGGCMHGWCGGVVGSGLVLL